MAETSSMPHIEVRDLTIGYGDFVVQRDLNFVVNKGDIFVIMAATAAARPR